MKKVLLVIIVLCTIIATVYYLFIPHREKNSDYACNTLQYFLDNEAKLTTLKHRITYAYNAGGGSSPYASGTTYDQITKEGGSYSLNQDACLSHDKKTFVFYLGGGRFCKDLYKYDLINNKREKVAQSNREMDASNVCISKILTGDIHKYEEYMIPVWGNYDGEIYTGLYNAQTNQIIQ